MIERRKIRVMGDHLLIPLHGRNEFYGWAFADLSDFALISRTSWTRDGRGYVVGRPPNASNSVTLHRYLMIGIGKGGLIDHRDGNKMDCRRDNLRHATHAGNAQNTRLAKNNSAGLKGIRLTANGMWNARITVNWRQIHIGNFTTKEEAGAAYDRAARDMHGEFASPNAT